MCCPDAMLFQISMHWVARCCCLTLCVESLLVFILLNETLEQKVEDEKEEEWTKEAACDIF